MPTSRCTECENQLFLTLVYILALITGHRVVPLASVFHKGKKNSIFVMLHLNNIFTSNKDIKMPYKLNKFHKISSDQVNNMKISDQLSVRKKYFHNNNHFCSNNHDGSDKCLINQTTCVLNWTTTLELLLSAGLLLEKENCNISKLSLSSLK